MRCVAHGPLLHRLLISRLPAWLETLGQLMKPRAPTKVALAEIRFIKGY